MPVTPLDILHREFRRGFRGYNDHEVQDFLRQASQDFEKVVTENAHLRDQVETLQQRLGQFERIEETMQNALVVAQRTAEETKRGAEKRAELIVADAEHQSRAMTDKARSQVAELEVSMSDLRQQRVCFELEFKALLETYHKMLDRHQIDPPEAEIPPTFHGNLSAETDPDQQLSAATCDTDDRSDHFATRGDGNGNSVVDGDVTTPRARLIDWAMVGAHAET